MESKDLKFHLEFNLKEKEIAQALEFQKLVIEEYKKLVPGQEKIEYYTDINNTTRFLIAREYKTSKAMEMWKKWYDWRTTYKADEIKEEEISHELKTGKAFWCGHDKENRPCLYLKIRRHFPKACPIEETLRFGIYLIENGVKIMEELGSSKMVVIWDREGFTSKNYDKSMLGMAKQLMGILQDFYAERLEAVYILHANWFFKMMYGIIKPFLAEKSRKKKKILSKTEDLLNYFDADQLLPEYGGTNKFEYRWPPNAEPVKDDVISPSTNENDEDINDPELKNMAEDAEKDFDLKQ